MIFSPVAGALLERLGRKNSIILGFVIVILATIGMAATQLINDKATYFYVSIVARFIQGMGDMWTQTSCK